MFVLMMRTRSATPRTIRSASPVGSWRTWSWSTRARARMVTVTRSGLESSSPVNPPGAFGDPFSTGQGGQLGRLRGAEQPDGRGGGQQPGPFLLVAEGDGGLAGTALGG
jgi:hypothetical protein